MKMTRQELDTLIEETQKVVSLNGQEVKVGVNLHGVDLSGEDLSGLDLSGANLHGANLSGCNLAGTILTGANCHEADFTGADLTKADVSEANLHGAKLVDCVCDEETKLDKSNLSFSDMNGLVGEPSKEGANLYESKG